MVNIQKIGIGTVQFGVDYGISNTNGQTSEEEIAKILKTAKANGIKYIDTASAYGNAENVLGNQNLKEFRVVSKFLPNNSKVTISSLLHKSLKNLNLEKTYGYLAHRPNSLLENKFYWEELNQLKTDGFVQKIGYSLNEPKELDDLLAEKYFPDLVQVPFNYFDRRFESRMKELKKRGCEIHTRSTFLQGLFFMNPEELTTFFDEVKPYIQNLQQQNESLPEALLNFVLKKNHIDRVIVGVETNKQLLQNIHTSNINKELKEIEFNFPDKIVMPMYWPK